MPTKAKDQTRQIHIFTKLGSQVDLFIAWVISRVHSIKAQYQSINADYITRIRSHRMSKALPPSLIILTLFLIMIPFLVERILSNDMVIWRSDTLSSNEEVVFSPKALVDGEYSQVLVETESLDEISSVGILFGTYARLNSANYEFILQQDGKAIYSQVFSGLSIKDNEYHDFKFTPIKLNPNSRYSFTLRVLSASENNHIAIFCQNDVTCDAVSRIGGRSGFYVFVIVLTAIFLIIFSLLNYLINSGKIKNESGFLVSMLVYIIPLTFIYPVFTIPDEPYHFISALRVSEYDWNQPPSQNLSRSEHILPSNSECLAVHFISITTPDPSVSEKIIKCFKPAPSESGMYISASNTSRALAYLPSALGIKFGDLISDSPMIIFYCGRIFNLLVNFLILIFAINLIKKHRMLLLAVIFIPIFLQQAISYSYDGLLNALCILVIAYGIRFLTMDVVVRRRDLLIITLALVFIGLIKLPYILVVTPLLFVKSEKFSKYRFIKWLLLFGLMAGALLSYVLSSRIEAIGGDGMLMLNPGDSDRGLPLSSLWAHPLGVIKMFLRTLGRFKIFYITSTIGFFGWFYFSLDFIIILAYIVFLVIVTMSDSENRLKKSSRFWILLAIIALMGSFFLVMYLNWTPKGYDVIDGVQGRYFLPAIPVLMFALMPKRRKIDLPSDSCYTFINLVTFCYIITLLIGFY